MKKTIKKYWFKRRLYGFGWTPTCWQGWATIVAFLIIFITGKKLFIDNQLIKSLGGETIYSAILIIAIICLFVVSLFKGPKPKWCWGKSKNDNPDEDI